MRHRSPFGDARQVRKRLRKSGLTIRELQVYRYIENYIKTQGRGPFYSEIGKFLDGKNPLHYKQRGWNYVKKLEGKGYIKMGYSSRRGVYRRSSSMQLTDKKPTDDIFNDLLQSDQRAEKAPLHRPEGDEGV